MTSKPRSPRSKANAGYSTMIITPAQKPADPAPVTAPVTVSPASQSQIVPAFQAPSIATHKLTIIFPKQGIEVPTFSVNEVSKRVTKAKHVRIVTQDYEIDNQDGNPPSEHYREFVHLHKMSATILPMCPFENKFLLIRQFRYPAWYNANQDVNKNTQEINEDSWMYETIAGVVETGETPEATAIREAKEEGNCIIDPSNVRLIHKAMMTPGITNEEMSFYLAIVPQTGADGVAGLASEGELIRAKWMTATEIQKLHASGLIRDCKTLLCLYAARIL